jgi:hypothetical protein
MVDDHPVIANACRLVPQEQCIGNSLREGLPKDRRRA